MHEDCHSLESCLPRRNLEQRERDINLYKRVMSTCKMYSVCVRKCKDVFWRRLRTLASAYFYKLHAAYLKDFSQGKFCNVYCWAMT